MRLKADLTLLLAAIIWGTAFAVQRVAAQVGSIFMFNGLRFMLGILVLLPWAGGLRWNLARRDWSVVLFAGVLLFAGSALQQMGMESTTAGNAGFLTTIYVVLVPVALFFGWHERPHWLAWIAAFLGVIGAFLLSTSGEFIFRPGDALELVGALFWTLHVIVLGKFASRMHPIRFAVGQMFIAGVLNLAVGTVFEGSISILQPAVFGGLIYTGIFSAGVAYTLQVLGQRHTPPTDAALILSLEGVVAALFGWWWLHETLLPVQIVGCALIFVAILLAQVKELALPPLTGKSQNLSADYTDWEEKKTKNL
jgi:drug/metabolite transporter (DMT)-like permease